MLLVLLGFFLGFFGSMPPTGPIAMLTIERALGGRLKEGFALALGGVAVEIGYIALAVFGMGALLAAYPNVVDALRWVAVAVLIGVGAYLVASRMQTERRDDEEEASAERLGQEFMLGLTLSGLNPTLALTWTTAVTLLLVITGLRFDTWNRFVFPLVCGAGSATWNLVLIFLVHRFGGQKLSTAKIRGVVRVLGAGLICLGLWQAWSLLSDDDERDMSERLLEKVGERPLERPRSAHLA